MEGYRFVEIKLLMAGWPPLNDVFRREWLCVDVEGCGAGSTLALSTPSKFGSEDLPLCDLAGGTWYLRETLLV